MGGGKGIVTAMPDLLEELTPVGRWPSLAEADEHALVVLAMNRDCRVRHDVYSEVMESSLGAEGPSLSYVA